MSSLNICRRLLYCYTSPHAAKFRIRFGSLAMTRSMIELADFDVLRQPMSCRYCSESQSVSHAQQLGNLIVEEKTLSKDLAKYVNPVLSPDLMKTLSTVTSIEVCLDSVYFVSMTKDQHVTHWNQINLLGSNHSKQSPWEILEQAFHVVERLPESSVYLFEHRISRKLSLNYMPLLMFIGRLQMSLQTLLDKDYKVTGNRKVYYVKDSFVTKTFDLRVGGERVSGQNVLKLIEEEQYPDHVHVSPGLWSRYNRVESGVFKERYANCFLMSLAFCQNILNKGNKS